METPDHSRLWPYKYLEIVLRYLMAVVAAHMIVVNGTSYSIFELLLIPGYYIEMGFSLAVALIIICWINYISNRLDKNFTWEGQLLVRAMLQFLFGLLVPVLIEFFMVALYFWSRAQINVLRTPFMNREFRLVILMICFFNLYCIAHYFIIKWWITQNELEAYRRQVVKDNDGHLPDSAGYGETEESADVNTPPVFIVHTATRSYPIAVEEIAYFYRFNGHVFLRPISGQDALVAQSLDQIEPELDKNQFFRVARHMIISRRSIVDYRPLNFGKIGITLKPAYREPVTASKIQAHDFRLWVKAANPKIHF